MLKFAVTPQHLGVHERQTKERVNFRATVSSALYLCPCVSIHVFDLSHAQHFYMILLGEVSI